MQAVAGEEETGAFVFPEFLNEFDGIFASARVTDFLALKNFKFFRLYDDMPSLYMSKQSVPLSLKLKGRVMCSLIKEFGARQNETIDGIRVFHGNNWIPIHPTSEEPVINLYAEASSKEVANRLSESMLKKSYPRT